MVLRKFVFRPILAICLLALLVLVLAPKSHGLIALLSLTIPTNADQEPNVSMPPGLVSMLLSIEVVLLQILVPLDNVQIPLVVTVPRIALPTLTILEL